MIQILFEIPPDDAHDDDDGDGDDDDDDDSVGMVREVVSEVPMGLVDDSNCAVTGIDAEAEAVEPEGRDRKLPL